MLYVNFVAQPASILLIVCCHWDAWGRNPTLVFIHSIKAQTSWSKQSVCNLQWELEDWESISAEFSIPYARRSHLWDAIRMHLRFVLLSRESNAHSTRSLLYMDWPDDGVVPVYTKWRLLRQEISSSLAQIGCHKVDFSPFMNLLCKILHVAFFLFPSSAPLILNPYRMLLCILLSIPLFTKTLVLFIYKNSPSK